MFELYEFVDRNIYGNFVVVDVDDFLDYFNGILQSYCEVVGLEYEEIMILWELGFVFEWDVWVGWYEDVLKSIGFKLRVKKNMFYVFIVFDLEEFFFEVVVVVEECMLYYEILVVKKILLKNNE